MATIHKIPTRSTQPLSALCPMPLALKSKKTYWPAIWARLAITRMSAAMIPHPPSHPVLGPKARVAQVKVVPQSGIGAVESLVPVGDEQHRDEGQDGDDGRLQARRSR